MTVKTESLRSAGTWIPSYQNIFLGYLSQMKQGRLELSLPSGERMIFGSSEHVEQAKVATIQVRSEVFFKRCILFGDIGFGESYTEGEWDSDDITKVIRWMVINWEQNPGVTGSKVSNFALGLLKFYNRFEHLLKDNNLAGSVRNISAHYDLGNQLFETFLDSTMTYSAADFSQGAQTLEEAQIAKFDRLAKSISVKPGDHVLEIGGGWGAFAIHLAQKYQAKVTTITVSHQQFQKIQERIKQHGLQDQVEAKLLDYRHVEGTYDKIVSVEMIEAVGDRHLESFFSVAERSLNSNGIMGLQVITSADSRYEGVKKGVDWIQKHIFPGSLIPSLGALSDAARSASKLQMHSLFDMGIDYARTLKLWREEFNRNHQKIHSLGFDQHFIRAWNYYFSYCEAAFAERHISVKQIAYTRPNNLNI